MGRTGGRSPAARTDKDLAAARALLADPAITVEEAARRLDVAPSTLYRHLPAGAALGSSVEGTPLHHFQALIVCPGISV